MLDLHAKGFVSLLQAAHGEVFEGVHVVPKIQPNHSPQDIIYQIIRCIALVLGSGSGYRSASFWETGSGSGSGSE
jgi:hypothetical protein